MRPRGEGPQRGGIRWWSLSPRRAPPLTPKGRAPTPSPKPSKVAQVVAQPLPLDVGAWAATVATRVTDACQTLVEQAAVTGVEAAPARGRAADHKVALSRAAKVQGNTQRALDRALDLANKRAEELVAVGGDLKEAQEGRHTAEVEAAQLRLEVEVPPRRGDDLQQRLGWLRRRCAASPPPSVPRTPRSRGWVHQGC